MAAHRYWRMYITANNGYPGGWYMTIAELQLRTSFGGATVCTGGTPISDSAYPGRPASYAFDGNTTSSWSSDSIALPHYIGYDFGAGNEKDIVEMSVMPADGINRYPTDWQLQYSDNGTTWATLFRVQFSDWTSAGPFVFNTSSNRDPVSNGASTFWRLRSTAVDGGSSLGLSTLVMRASAGGADQCAGGTPFASTALEPALTDGLASNAFDGAAIYSGTTLTSWRGATVTEWIGYRFASAKTITEIGITARSTFINQSPKDFVLEYWNGSTFQTAFTITGSSGWGATETRYFNASGLTSGAAPAFVRTQIFICT
jgi:hypothetical protein